MARAWLIDSRAIARKVKNATQVSSYQTKDWGAEANRPCPNCNHRIDNSDVSTEWPGLPAGVKFDPSDLEILEHLAGKIGIGNSKPHSFIDEFIPTLEEEEGICYTHPENLPGVKKDGSSVHFFHRTANAYATGHRKRRRIHRKSSWSGGHVRWHKTGKTRPIIENGVQKGCKKIMVLYKSSTKGSKPDKFNWVMHQYHLGTEESEKEGEFVVSKILYQQQQKQSENADIDPANLEPYALTGRSSPRTPKTNAPQPPRSGMHTFYGEEEKLQDLPGQVVELCDAEPQCDAEPECEKVNSAWWAGESQAIEDPDPGDMDNMLFCDEILEPYLPVDDLVLDHLSCFSDNRSNVLAGGGDNALNGGADVTDPHFIGISELENIELDTDPDLQLADLQFGSQESIMSWLDRL